MFYGKDGKRYRATINARVTAIREDLELIQTRGMKSDKARAVYSKKTKAIHDTRKNQLETLWKTPPKSLLNQALTLQAA
jgi:hypothetical protein